MTDPTNQPAPPRLDDQLCFALHAASRAITKAYRPALDSLGLTYTQYITLMVLWETDGLGVRDLGARLRLDSGTLTPLLKRLERDGLVTRTRDPGDERRVLVNLTEDGKEMSDRAAEIQSELVCKLSENLDDLPGLKARLEELVGVLDSL